MRIQSSVTAISWIPSEAVEAAAEAAVHDGCRALRLTHRPTASTTSTTMHRADLFREANELHAWIEVEDGKITDYGQTGGGRIGLTRLKLGPKEIAVPAVAHADAPERRGR